MRTLFVFAFFLASVTPADFSFAGSPLEPAQSPPGRGADAIVAEVAGQAPELLARYIRVDTTNPPGSELDAVEFLSDILEAAGVEAQVFQSAAGRGNLYARLRGSGERRPIILLSHVDVVPADPAAWKRPPFGGEIANGRVHGRGALDAKGVGVVQLLAVVALARLQQERGEALSRDVILLATSDEEMGGKNGAGWMVRNRMELFENAEFLINEGGFIRAREAAAADDADSGADGAGELPMVFNLNAGEKGPCWFSVIASGDPGHGSRPAVPTSVNRLADALVALAAWEQPIEVGPVVAGYYAAYAALDKQHARQFRQLDRSLEDPEFRAWFLSDPAAAALVRNTMTPTVLAASPSTNIVPAEARAGVDARLLPGYECEDFLGSVRRRIGTPNVRVEASDVAFPSSQSPLLNDLTRAVESLAAEEPGGAVVLPGLQAGFTDSHYFRALGIASYGFTPIAVTSQQRLAIHGRDESVDTEELAMGVRRIDRKSVV